MKNKILIWTARIVFTLMCAFLCLLDSDSTGVFLFLASLCGAYLTLYGWVNRDYKGVIM